MTQIKTATADTFLGHPKGLAILFLTEMWERFSFYGMRALLVLFLVDKLRGGLGWSQASALDLYGFYTMSVYVLGIAGGYIADRWIGHKAAVLLGALLACAGHFLMATQHQTLFMLGLSFIAAGTGLLKPNISTLVGSLYAAGDLRRDAGFTLFYMGINVGALLSSLVVGYIGEVYGWHYGFGLAGVCMLFGIAIFLVGQQYLININVPASNTIANEAARPALKQSFTEVEKDRIWALALSFITTFSFFVAFEQGGGLLNLYTEKYIDRTVFGWEIPTSMFQSLNPAFIILLTPVVAAIWSSLSKRYSTISSFYKLGAGNIMVGVGFLFMVGAALQLKIPGIERASLSWLVMAYFFHTIGELCLSPVSLSFVTKLAPERMSGSLMGAYFAAIGFSQYLAAWLGKKSETLGDLNLFQFIFWMTLCIGLPFIIFNRRLMKLTHGAE
jgi:POT family proton-dependent oligopeptide transporter